VRSVIIDGPDSWCQTLQDDNMIEKFIGIDFSDAESVFDKCLAACKKVQKVCSLSLFVCILCVYSFHWPHPCVSSFHFLIVFPQSISFLVFPHFIRPCTSSFHCSQHNIMSASQYPQANLPSVSQMQQWTLRANFGRLSVLLLHKHLPSGRCCLTFPCYPVHAQGLYISDLHTVHLSSCSSCVKKAAWPLNKTFVSLFNISLNSAPHVALFKASNTFLPCTF